MTRTRQALSAIAASIFIIGGGVLVGASPASAWIVCVPYTETTGSCYQDHEDGTHSWFLYWGNYWIEF